jgi:hypothetical protein
MKKIIALFMVAVLASCTSNTSEDCTSTDSCAVDSCLTDTTVVDTTDVVVEVESEETVLTVTK